MGALLIRSYWNDITEIGFARELVIVQSAQVPRISADRHLVLCLFFFLTLPLTHSLSLSYHRPELDVLLLPVLKKKLDYLPHYCPVPECLA